MKVSIITVCFNSKNTIEDTILSVLSQSYKNIEYIIIDGNSKDGTIDIINKYKSKISKIISENDNGIYDAMNKGIFYATGDIIGIINSDDMYVNNNIIEKVVHTLKNNPSAEGSYSNLNYVSNSGKLIRKWTSNPINLKLFKYGWTIPHPTLFLKKQIYKNYGNYNLSFGNAADYEFILRVVYYHKIDLIYSKFISVHMKIGGASNKSLKNIIFQNIKVIEALKKYNIKYSIIVFCIYKITNRLIQYLKK